MTKSRSRPPFRADHVGSLILPQALIDACDSHEAGRVPRDEAIVRGYASAAGFMQSQVNKPGKAA